MFVAHEVCHSRPITIATTAYATPSPPSPPSHPHSCTSCIASSCRWCPFSFECVPEPSNIGNCSAPLNQVTMATPGSDVSGLFNRCVLCWKSTLCVCVCDCVCVCFVCHNNNNASSIFRCLLVLLTATRNDRIWVWKYLFSCTYFISERFWFSNTLSDALSNQTNGTFEAWIIAFNLTHCDTPSHPHTPSPPSTRGPSVPPSSPRPPKRGTTWCTLTTRTSSHS